MYVQCMCLFILVCVQIYSGNGKEMKSDKVRATADRITVADADNKKRALSCFVINLNV